MADRYNMFSSSRPLPGWNPQSANKDGEYYDKGKLATVPGSITPPLRDNVFSAEELGISNNAVTQSTPVSGYVSTGDRDRDITSYLTNTFSDPDEEDRLRRQSRNRMAIMAVGDAIRQLGNIYHTSRYAPSQKFNNPLENEYGRYYAEKRVRDADRYKKMVMQQQRDKLEAEQKQKEFENGLKTDYNKARISKLESDAKAAADRIAETNRHNIALEGISKSRAEETARANKERESQGRERISIARGNAAETRRHHSVMENRSGSGSRGGSGSGSSGGYMYQTTNGGVISMKKNWNDTQKKQWEQWMRSKHMFTDDYEERLSEANSTERDKLISNAIAFALRNNKSAEDFAIRNFGATQVHASAPSKTTASKSGNTQKKASPAPKKAGTSVASNAQKSTTGKIKIDW